MSEQPDYLFQEDGCPACQSTNVTPVKYTWWGGVIGPKLLHHTKCNECGYVYNRKTRKSNNTNIAIYFIVSFVVLMGVYYFIYR